MRTSLKDLLQLLRYYEPLGSPESGDTRWNFGCYVIAVDAAQVFGAGLLPKDIVVSGRTQRHCWKERNMETHTACSAVQSKFIEFLIANISVVR